MIHQFKTLNGDPHYVAMGMAIGVFIAITPTIPFHTVLAIGLAVIFKGSKPAAIVGVWVSNPVTVVFLYVACYKAGHLFFPNAPDALASIQTLIHHLESDVPFSEKMGSLNAFISTQVKTFMIMNLGGLILGIPVGVVSYFITRSFFTRVRRQKKMSRKDQSNKKHSQKNLVERSLP